MAIFKVGETYKAEIYSGAKRIKTKSGFKNKSQAKKWHDEQKMLLQINPNSSSTNNNLKFSPLVEKYISDYVNTSVKTTSKERYQIDIKRRIIPEFGQMKVLNITPVSVQNFQNRLVKTKKLSFASINRCMVVLQSIFNKSIEWELCLFNPCKRVKRLKEVRKPYRWWRNKEVVLKFLNHIEHHRLYLFFRVALETGIRLGELVGLTWDAINLETGQVEIYRQYNVKSDNYAPLKNNQFRTVWLPTSTVPLLRHYRLRSKTDHVFSNLDGSILRSDTVGQKIFLRLQREAGVSLINFHGLRHTYASHYMMNGGNIYDLSKLLGHSSIEVTIKYAHLSPEVLLKNRDRVNFDNSNIAIFEKSSSLHYPFGQHFAAT